MGNVPGFRRFQSSESEPDPQQIQEISAAIHNTDPNQVFSGFQRARKILSAHILPLDTIVQADIVPKCVQSIGNDGTKCDTKREAAWIITNIAAGSSEHVAYLIEQRAMAAMVLLLQSKNPQVIEQAVWALGNFAGDSATNRDLVINAGAVPELVRLSQSKESQRPLLSRLAWTLSNLCRGQDSPTSTSIEAVRQILPGLAHLLNTNYYFNDVKPQACWALAYLARGSREGAEEVLNAGLGGQLVQFLTSSQKNLITPALHAIGSIVKRNDELTERILAAGPVIQALDSLMIWSRQLATVKMAARVISEIAAGSIGHINAIINGGCVPNLIWVINYGVTKKEAVWVLQNIAKSGQPDHIEYMYRIGVIQAICPLFKYPDDPQDTLLTALQTLEQILASAVGDADKAKKYKKAVEDCGCDGLEKLAQAEIEDGEVSKCAYKILDKFFNKKMTKVHQEVRGAYKFW